MNSLRVLKSPAANLLRFCLLTFAVVTGGHVFADTHDVFVQSDVLGSKVNPESDDLEVAQEDQHVELDPGDPIRHVVTYGREAPGPGGHQFQGVIVSVYLSTDGNPNNPNNFLLDSFGDGFAAGGLSETYTEELVNALPPHFTGTYFLISMIRVVSGPGDPDLNNNFPGVTTTATARVTIRPVDMPTVERVSVSSEGGETNELSESPSISSDGRYVAFHSEATNLVSAPAAPGGVAQVYLRDNQTGVVTMVSQLFGSAGNQESRFPVISADGKYIAYQSTATNLVYGPNNTDTNLQTDVFLYSVDTGATTRISLPNGAPTGVQANSGSFLPSISGDGLLIAFESDASNLVTGDTNGRRDVFVANRVTRAVQAASRSLGGVLGNAASTQPRISEDGSTVVFRSFARNLTSTTKVSTWSEILAKHLATGTVARISVLRDPGTGVITELDDDAFDPAVSADGRHVAFATRATNIAAPDGTFNVNEVSQVYVVNRSVDGSAPFEQIGNVSLNLISREGMEFADALPGFGDDESLAPIISGNGRYVGFRTESGNLQPLIKIRSDGEVFFSSDIWPYSDGESVVFKSIEIDDPGSGYTSAPTVTIEDSFTGETATAIAEVDTDPSSPTFSQVISITFIDRGSGYFFVPDVTLSGGQTPATATAEVDTDPLSPTFGQVISVTITDPGTLYTSNPTVTFSGGGIAGATATAVVDLVTPDSPTFGQLTDITIINPGGGYTTPPTVTFTGGFSPAIATATVDFEDGSPTEGMLEEIEVAFGGSGYSTPPTVTISGGGGAGARAYAVIDTDPDSETYRQVTDVILTNLGSGYTSLPTITFSGGFDQATADAVIDTDPLSPTYGQVTGFNITSFGSGYTAEPTITLSGGQTIATATASIGVVTGITVTDGGAGYTAATVTISGGGGTGATADAVVDTDPVSPTFGQVTSVTLTNGGSGYTSEPTVTINGDGTGATATATVNTGLLGSITITFAGAGYTSAPTVIITGGGISQASASIAFSTPLGNSTSDVYMRDTGIQAITVTDSGSGYTSEPTITITGGGGSGAQAVAVVDTDPTSPLFGVVARIDITDPGSGYMTPPTVTLSGGGGTGASASAELTTGSERLSVSTFGEQTGGLGPGRFEVPSSRTLVMSSDGRYVLFTSEAAGSGGFIFGKSNQFPLDGNSKRDVFMMDRRVGVGVPPDVSDLPTIALSTPDSTTVVVGAQVTLLATATSQTRSIASVEFYANNQLIGTATQPLPGGDTTSYSVTWTAPSPGNGNTSILTYDVAAIAVDSSGLRSSLSNIVTFTVRPVIGTPPTVSIVSPVPTTVTTTGEDGEEVTTIVPITSGTGTTLTFVAEAIPGTSNIVTVNFYAQGTSAGLTLLGQGVRDALSNQYILIYTNTLTFGSYNVIAEAIDANGNVARSAGLPINVIFLSPITSAITDLYQGILQRQPSTAEINADTVLFAGVSTAEGKAVLATRLIESAEFRDGGGEIILSYLAVFGVYPSYAQYVEGLALRTADTEGTDADLVTLLLTSPEYEALYGDLDTTSEAGIRAFALRSYNNLFGKPPTYAATADDIAQQFYDNIVILGFTPAEALITFGNTYLDGGKEGNLLKKIQVAGLLIGIGKETPSRAKVDALAALPLLDVARYVVSGTSSFAIKPIITRQPQSVTVEVGGPDPVSVTFSVEVVGFPVPHIQWFKNGQRIIGANASTYTIASVTALDAGKYTVTATNTVGSVTSMPAYLTIKPVAPNALDSITIRKVGDAAPAGYDLGPTVPGLKYYASGLPRGLKLDPLTGAITGRISASPGVYTVTYWSQIGSIKSVVQRVTFAVDPFPVGMTGTREALLEDGFGLPAGKFTLTISKQGTFTGRLVHIDGKAYSVKGALLLASGYGSSSSVVTINRTAPALPLTLNIVVAANGSIVGTAVVDSLITYTVNESLTSVPQSGVVWAGSRNVAFDGGAAGFGVVAASSDGSAKLTYTDETGKRLTASGKGSVMAEYALYIPYVSGTPNAYFGGWMDLNPEPRSYEFYRQKPAGSPEVLVATE